MENAEPEAPFRAVDDIGIRVPRTAMTEVDPEVQAMVMRLAGITRGAGIVMAAREIKADPTSTLRTILALLRLLVFGRAQQTIDEVKATAPRLGCKSGCAWCCYQNVEVTIPEAILVAAHIAADDPRRQRIAEAAATLGGLDDSARRRAGKPCPLLVDNRCSVYDDRPLMCRGMMAADAEGCRSVFEAGVTGEGSTSIEFYPMAQYFMLGDQAGMRGILKDMGLQHEPVEMTRAVAAILADPDIVERWLARECAFGPDVVLADETEPAPAP
ncbi:MAG TPA: YkgJ family cysteine cluster protein [Stellaceae bacterium]|nr:YkgJ family cysteine cluster protein [Stellaceae bacterium]